MNINKLRSIFSNKAPLHVHISITSDCNLRCIHCYGSYGLEKKEIPFNFLKKILKYLKENNIIYVNISGGEPTVYPNFLELINYLDKIELPYYLTTNGIISDKLFNKIYKSKMLLAVKVSLDGIKPNSHLFVRDPINKNINIYNRTIKILEKFKKKKIYTIVGTLVHSKNYNELIKFPKFLYKLGIKKWIIGPLLLKGRGNVNKSKLESKNISKLFRNLKYVNKLLKECEKYNIELDISDFKTLDGRKYVFKCGAGIHYYHISSDGIAYPCPLIPYSRFSNEFAYPIIKPKDVIEVWNSYEFRKWRLQQIVGCPDCKLRDKCARCPIQLDILNKNNIYDNIDFCLVKD